MLVCHLLQIAFERNRGGQSIDMICRELMLDEEKAQAAKRPRTKKKKGAKAASQPPDETRATETTVNGTTDNCLVRCHHSLFRCVNN